jgi:hypothetical protein
MKPIERGILTIPWCGALLALLAMVTLSPAAARAGCSAHDLILRSQAGGGISYLDLLSSAGALSTPTDQAPRQRPAPCSGAFCSGNPASPVSPLPSVSSIGVRHWAIVALHVGQLEAGTLQGLFVDADLRPIDVSCTVFHPPRSPAFIISLSQVH